MSSVQCSNSQYEKTMIRYPKISAKIKQKRCKSSNIYTMVGVGPNHECSIIRNLVGPTRAKNANID